MSPAAASVSALGYEEDTNTFFYASSTGDIFSYKEPGPQNNIDDVGGSMITKKIAISKGLLFILLQRSDLTQGGLKIKRLSDNTTLNYQLISGGTKN